MSKGLITTLSVVGIFVVLIFSGIGSYVGNANYGNASEKRLNAKLDDTKNILSNYYNKVTEIVQVADAYKDGLKEIVTADIQGRYGTDGSKATMQWLKEHNVQLNDTLYLKLEQVIEAGRNEFQHSQTELLDQKRSYETSLGYVWKGFWLHLAGYPKINLADIKIVISDKTNTVYQTGVENGLQLHPAK